MAGEQEGHSLEMFVFGAVILLGLARESIDVRISSVSTDANLFIFFCNNLENSD